MRIATTARYRGLPVALVGVRGVALLAVAAYGTPQELALATVAVQWRDGRWVYRRPGASDWTDDPDAVARAVAASCEARDAAAFVDTLT
jgi:hypothetical protein